jgi:lipopolysaccharide/colanic/teichoic acid biosynthesis glycosyltransferase
MVIDMDAKAEALGMEEDYLYQDGASEWMWAADVESVPESFWWARNIVGAPERADRRAAEWLYAAAKRAIDIIGSLVGLVGLSPLFLALAIIIRATSEGPAFFVQERVGKNGVPFRFYKFRSMAKDAERKLDSLLALNERTGPVFKIVNDPRITPVGRLIRKYCIDELPQLLNVLKGEMSIVGPRPPLPREVAQYTTRQVQRLSVKPGLTCFWQVRKSENLPFDEWVALDLKYIRERSLWTDIKLIFMTVAVLISGKGDQ